MISMEKAASEIAKESPKILLTVYGDLLQPGVKKVGLALETVLELSTSFLLPLKLMNEKVKLKFEKNLNDFKKKLDKIPEEKILDVDPHIGNPILDKLTFVSNEEIVDLFTSLLTKASSTDTVNQAHPAFIQVIERLSVDEARIIKSLIGKSIIHSISFKLYMKATEGYSFIVRDETMLKFENLLYPENIQMYISNLISAGIFSKSIGSRLLLDETKYSELAEKFNYSHYISQFSATPKFDRLEKENGYYEISEFGKAFIKACAS